MKQLRSLQITTTPKNDDSEPYVSQIVIFDRAGNEISRSEFSGPGEFESKTETRYDASGKIIEVTTYLDEEEIAERKKYDRNSEGKVEKVDIEFTDGSASIQTVERDDSQHTENWIERDEDGELESREFLKFDEKGNLILKESYDFNDKLTEAIEYDYYPDGEVHLRRQLDERRKLILETEYKYTEGGLLLLRVSRNRRGDLSDFLKIEYNDNGQPIKQSFSGKYIFLYEYDEQGNTIVEEQYSGDTLDNRITSEYDENKRLVLEDQVKFSRTFVYEYFD